MLILKAAVFGAWEDAQKLSGALYQVSKVRYSLSSFDVACAGIP